MFIIIAIETLQCFCMMPLRTFCERYYQNKAFHRSPLVKMHKSLWGRRILRIIDLFRQHQDHFPFFTSLLTTAGLTYSTFFLGSLTSTTHPFPFFSGTGFVGGGGVNTAFLGYSFFTSSFFTSSFFGYSFFLMTGGV